MFRSDDDGYDDYDQYDSMQQNSEPHPLPNFNLNTFKQQAGNGGSAPIGSGYNQNAAPTSRQNTYPDDDYDDSSDDDDASAMAPSSRNHWEPEHLIVSPTVTQSQPEPHKPIPKPEPAKETTPTQEAGSPSPQNSLISKVEPKEQRVIQPLPDHIKQIAPTTPQHPNSVSEHKLVPVVIDDLYAGDDYESDDESIPGPLNKGPALDLSDTKPIIEPPKDDLEQGRESPISHGRLEQYDNDTVKSVIDDLTRALQMSKNRPHSPTRTSRSPSPRQSYITPPLRPKTNSFEPSTIGDIRETEEIPSAPKLKQPTILSSLPPLTKPLGPPPQVDIDQSHSADESYVDVFDDYGNDKVYSSDENWDDEDKDEQNHTLDVSEAKITVSSPEHNKPLAKFQSEDDELPPQVESGRDEPTSFQNPESKLYSSHADVHYPVLSATVKSTEIHSSSGSLSTGSSGSWSIANSVINEENEPNQPKIVVEKEQTSTVDGSKFDIPVHDTNHNLNDTTISEPKDNTYENDASGDDEVSLMSSTSSSSGSDVVDLGGRWAPQPSAQPHPQVHSDELDLPVNDDGYESERLADEILGTFGGDKDDKHNNSDIRRQSIVPQLSATSLTEATPSLSIDRALQERRRSQADLTMPDFSDLNISKDHEPTEEAVVINPPEPITNSTNADMDPIYTSKSMSPVVQEKAEVIDIDQKDCEGPKSEKSMLDDLNGPNNQSTEEVIVIESPEPTTNPTNEEYDKVIDIDQKDSKAPKSGRSMLDDLDVELASAPSSPVTPINGPKTNVLTSPEVIIIPSPDEPTKNTKHDSVPEHISEKGSINGGSKKQQTETGSIDQTLASSPSITKHKKPIQDFKKIMSLPNSVVRREAFHEIRVSEAAIDTGLHEWLSSVLTSTAYNDTPKAAGPHIKNAYLQVQSQGLTRKSSISNKVQSGSRRVFSTSSNVLEKVGGNAHSFAKGFLSRGKRKLKKGSDK